MATDQPTDQTENSGTESNSGETYNVITDGIPHAAGRTMDGLRASAPYTLPMLAGAAIMGVGYLLTTMGASYFNTRGINTEGIEQTVLVDNEGEENEKRFNYVTLPRTGSGQVDMMMNEDGSGTSLAYRNSVLEAKADEVLAKDQAQAQTNYEAAEAEANEAYNAMNDKKNDAKEGFGWKPEPKPEAKPVKPIEEVKVYNTHADLDELDAHLDKLLNEAKK